ncbi:C39 family peptidase [Marinospirillum sp.]|uniref:C39 family peptidase n=1 Tax=Marinospirillum sp. TaxID=2183934 RepID=UPI00384B7215
MMLRTLVILCFLVFSLVGNAQHLAAASLQNLKPLNQLQMQKLERQTLDYSCGAAALSILLTHYFEDPWEEKVLLANLLYRLSDEERIERVQEGFSLLDLKNTAEQLGYSAEGVYLSASSLEILPGPIIILLRREKLNHFVVLKGAAEGKAFLADPVRGHLRLPIHQLLEEWQGEALVLGRANFGLPQQHALALPSSPYLAPERETLRSLLPR